MIRISICLLAGALAPQLSSFPPESDQIALLLVLLLPAIVFLRRVDAACIVIGSLLFCLQVAYAATERLSPDYASDSMLVVVRVADFPQSRRATTSFIAVPVGDERIPARIRLSWFEPPVGLRIGDVWKLQVRLRRPRGNANPGAIDTEAWLTRHRIGATGYVVAGSLNELVDAQTASGITRLRQHALETIDRRIGDRTTGAVVAAIVVGARHRLSDEQWERYAHTGTSHLMAISGLHIGLAAFGAFYAARLILGLSGFVSNQRRVALVLSLLVALLYAAISGFAVPTQRALVMLSIAGAALLLSRETDGPRVLALAAIAIVAADPLTTMAPGFWLSFAAVAVLYWFSRRLTLPLRRPWARPFIALRTLAAVQLYLFVGLLPLTVLFFDRVSLAAPLVNLAAVPVFSTLAVPFALLSLPFGGPFEAVGGLLLGVAARGVDIVESLIVVAAAEPRGARTIPALAGAAWLCLALPVAWLVLPAGWPMRHAAPVGILLLLAWKPAAPPQGCTDLIVLDVGQGLAVLVRAGERTLLYDTGPVFRSGGSAAEQIVLPVLRQLGVTRIDRLVVSHADLDHAGGVAAIAAALPVGDVLAGETLPTPGARPCHAGIAWYWEGTRFTILHPEPSAVTSGNDASCVLMIETGALKTMLTGDIEAPAEAALVRRRVLPLVDVATVPHHGSRTSSIMPFVKSLSPRYAIVSAAYANQWDFPKPDVVERWRSVGAVVLKTATSGAIRIRQCDTNSVSRIERHRHVARRIWHDRVRDAEF